MKKPDLFVLDLDGVMTDVVAITSNNISITPLHLDLTHVDSIETLRNSLKR